MDIVHTKKEVRSRVSGWKKKGETVGLVPTMGFLHKGHGSLIEHSVADNDHTIVSVFVNPMQFAKGEDLERYPRDMERDAALCEELGADLIFNPSPEEMYGDVFYTYTDMDVLTKGLCGKSRPGMFRGVCTVCSKLFNIAAPDRAYFGKKDAQQLAVMRRMAADMDYDIEIVGCSSVREADGLAMSSRNTYLSEEERKKAPAIYKGLCRARELAEQGERDSGKLKKAFLDEVDKVPGFSVDYCSVVDGADMQEIERIKGDGSDLMAVAAKLGKTRLIDNIDL